MCRWQPRYMQSCATLPPTRWWRRPAMVPPRHACVGQLLPPLLTSLILPEACGWVHMQCSAPAPSSCCPCVELAQLSCSHCRSMQMTSTLTSPVRAHQAPLELLQPGCSMCRAPGTPAHLPCRQAYRWGCLCGYLCLQSQHSPSLLCMGWYLQSLIAPVQML